MESAIDHPDQPTQDDDAERRRDLIVEASQLDSPSRARAFSRESQQVDWFVIIVALERREFNHRRIAETIGNSVGSIGFWKTGTSQPAHNSGEALISLWCSVSGLPRDQVPMRKDGQLSAARVK